MSQSSVRTPADTFTLIEPGILLSQPVGRVNASTIRERTLKRLEFVRQHPQPAYVLLYDTRQAIFSPNVLSLRLLNWAIYSDPGMVGFVILGSHFHIRLAVDLLRKLGSKPFTWTHELDDAIAQARKLLAYASRERESATP
jgi:hypothetical protein